MKFDFDSFDTDDASVDLTSLIDVLFLLLTFFILAATFASPGINVNLTEAKTAEGRSTRSDIITISVNTEGDLFYQDAKILSDDLGHILSEFDAETYVVFNIDEKAPFESFIRVLDEVKQNGFTNFFINTNIKKE